MGDDVQVLRNRHFALMDAMLAHPEWTQRQLGEALNYSESRVGDIVNSSLFKTAFSEYRARFQKELQASIVEATLDAIQVSQEIIKDKGTPTALRQVSISAILSQGHAKAMEKRANLNMEMEVPAELLPRMEEVMQELGRPRAPLKMMERPPEDETEEG
jgi:hypothetical protein